MPVQPPPTRLTFRVAASNSDIASLVNVAHKAHSETRFSHIPFNVDKAVKVAQAAIAKKDPALIILAERDGEAVGFIYCMVGEYYIGSGVLVATVHSFSVLRDFRSV